MTSTPNSSLHSMNQPNEAHARTARNPIERRRPNRPSIVSFVRVDARPRTTIDDICLEAAAHSGRGHRGHSIVDTARCGSVTSSALASMFVRIVLCFSFEIIRKSKNIRCVETTTRRRRFFVRSAVIRTNETSPTADLRPTHVSFVSDRNCSSSLDATRQRQ
jgi:hypothetical protein